LEIFYNSKIGFRKEGPFDYKLNLVLLLRASRKVRLLLLCFIVKCLSEAATSLTTISWHAALFAQILCNVAAVAVKPCDEYSGTNGLGKK